MLCGPGVPSAAIETPGSLSGRRAALSTLLARRQSVVRIQWALLLGILMLAGCAAPSLESRRDAAQSAISALQRGKFDQAEKEAKAQAERDRGNPYALLVRAIVRYKKTMHQLVLDGRTVVIGGIGSGAVNQKYLVQALRDADSELALVEADLAVVAEEPSISVELCVACWEIDWDGNGRINDRDRRLPEIEVDADGEDIPEDDPRRRPTFRFDVGDVAWARAFVSFQRAAIDVLLAYDWGPIGTLEERLFDGEGELVIPLVDAPKIAEARQRILEGLAFSDASRDLYLAETDDDREWVPNPRQKSHPMPLPVDQELYDTWEGVVGDVRRLVAGEEGLSVADAMSLLEGRRRVRVGGYIDIGKMLSSPKDIRIDLRDLEKMEHDRDLDGMMAAIFGEYYRKSMKPSPLTKRLLRMKDEVDRGERELDRKLRYLFWIN